MHDAVERGDGLIVLLLLESSHRLEVNAMTNNGDIALHLAVKNRGTAPVFSKVLLVNLLAEHGADINATRTVDGKTALDLTIEISDEVMLKHLSYKPDIKTRNTSLLLASQTGQLSMVELLLHYGADIETRSELENKSPLHRAVEICSKPIFELLLTHGADVYARVEPLHIAARKGSCIITQLLIDYGADVDAKTNRDMRPIHCTVQDTGHGGQLVELLLGNGAFIEPGFNRKRPDHVFIMNASAQVTTELSGKEAVIKKWLWRQPARTLKTVQLSFWS